MVFFNYSTMQMAAKVVYYGPGLGGKTTNLQYIYSRTAEDSRGEMVSLETETDRTLFFDLLPLDVGSIGGFETRVQLYTVPGQVFYNTTRKLVLKGVDGIVFVADSQRPMLQANIDSFKNLEANLEEMGLSVDDVPIVLQYNKRDLQDISSVDELNQALNRDDWHYFASEAINGDGVFETLKAISKLTLMSLKERLASDSTPRSAAPSRPQVAATSETDSAETPTGAAPTSEPADPVEVEVATPDVAPPPSSPATTPPSPTRTRRVRSSEDVLEELEKIRRQTLTDESPSSRERRTTATANGRRQIDREIQLTLNPDDLERARRFLLSLQVEDGDHEIVDAIRDFHVDIGELKRRDDLVVRLNIALRAEE